MVLRRVVLIVETRSLLEVRTRSVVSVRVLTTGTVASDVAVVVIMLARVTVDIRPLETPDDPVNVRVLTCLRVSVCV